MPAQLRYSFLHQFAADSQIISGKYFKLVSYFFLHKNVAHLYMNLLGFYMLGFETEGNLTSLKYIFLLVVSSVMAGIAAPLFYTRGVIGASGALYGLLGYNLKSYRRRYCRGMRTWVFFVMLVLFFGIDSLLGYFIHAAVLLHLFALIVGFLLSFFIKEDFLYVTHHPQVEYNI
jgi:membrane associated rhomboid family serine protease